DYLLQYGYLQKPLEGPADFRPEDIMEALRAFQEASELPVSGQLDSATRAHMRQPRCGLEDPFNQKTLKPLMLEDLLGVNLRIITAHEPGRALGLGLCWYTQALMAPGYAGCRPRFKLEFGPSMVSPALRDHENQAPWKTCAFKGNYVWTVTDSGLGPLFQVSALREGLLGSLDAAVHSPQTQWIHFFKGWSEELCCAQKTGVACSLLACSQEMVWHYINSKMSPGFPKKLNRVAPNLDAALYWPLNQKVFLFKGSRYWRWDELAQTDFSRYPKPIKGPFTGVPDQPWQP
ncbi:hypothetical protein MC885_005032, partial [Smutsia gigantea]